MTLFMTSQIDGKRLGLLDATLLMLALSIASLGAQTPTVRADQDVHGRKGWVVETDRIHMAFLEDGGHIADINLISRNPRLSINPMFIRVGNGYMGHMVCFPNVGPASPEERQNGIGGHGEANGVPWKQTRPPQVDAEGITFFYGAELPKTQYRIERAVSLKNGETIIHVEESIENLTPYDRTYNYDQHPTFGAPFVALGKTVLDMSGTKGMTDPRRTAGNQWAPAHEFQWPNAPREDGTTVSMREFRGGPGGQAYTAVLSDLSRPTGWFTLFNSDYPLLIGYVFSTTDHPWIIDWQNRPQADSTVGTARAVLFGTSPIDEGQRKSVERGQLFGTPSYRFIAAKQRLSTAYTIFLTEIPSGFAGVQDVRMEQRTIEITERTTGRRITAR
jgi:hypothetical protein